MVRINDSRLLTNLTNLASTRIDKSMERVTETPEEGASRESCGARLPNDILLLIFRHVRPQPWDYMRLAMVSKFFYHYFTSDRAWEFLNPYGWKSDIHKQFLNVLDTEDEMDKARFFWHRRPDVPCAHGFKRQIHRAQPGSKDNKYVHLGYIVTEIHFGSEPVSPFLQDMQMVWCAVNIEPWTFSYATGEPAESIELATIAVRGYPLVFIHLEASLRANKAITLAALKASDGPESSQITLHMGYELKSDVEVMLAAIEMDGHNLMSASADLQSNEAIVRLAVMNNPSALYFSKVLNPSKELVEVGVSGYGRGLRGAQRFCDEEGIVELAVKQNGLALEYASTSLKDVKSLVMLAVRKRGKALEFASDRLKNDLEVVTTAVKSQSEAIEFASDVLKDNHSVVSCAVRSWPRALKFASPRLQNTYEIVHTAVSIMGEALKYASAELQSNKELVEIAITHPVTYSPAGPLGYSPAFRNDSEMILKALRFSISAFELANDDMKADDEFLEAAIIANPQVLRVSYQSRKNKKLALLAVSLNGLVYDELSGPLGELQYDQDVVLAAVGNAPCMLQYVPEELAFDSSFTKKLIETVNNRNHNLNELDRRISEETLHKFNMMVRGDGRLAYRC